MFKEYYIIGQESECEIIINKSKFIGRAFPIQDEKDALEKIQSIRERYPDATHHCYAYVTGENNSIQRFNDDGEPGGTAGMPILQVIQQQQIENVLVVVTRYFGGIKLGAGGLVRAYSKAASEAISKAGKYKMKLCYKGTIKLDYSHLGTIEYFLKQERIPVLNKEYLENVSIELITNMDWDRFCSLIIEKCNGKVGIGEAEEIYYPWDDRDNIENL